jgi:hypothetical protein
MRAVVKGVDLEIDFLCDLEVDGVGAAADRGVELIFTAKRLQRSSRR